ncbi:hypothetical protein KY290_000465 [Solanum tuberosum]|uniref:MULE transposase domain-containing protein n=1 Tax=Solanum tuberosum TaxID=4113 RepID=A0ABQ7WJE1_SOLTU|nr:hypothetical protein KY284_003912 [Solanum tuberosum]KAH0780867.1 hypothetical protein KY290_000465 [Solanum tuberosum]
MTTTSWETYNGTFVSVSTLDGAGNILSLAYDTVDSKNDASCWIWFFEQFREASGLKENMCIVSDRNTRFIKIVSRAFESVLCHDKGIQQSDFDVLMEKVNKLMFG